MGLPGTLPRLKTNLRTAGGYTGNGQEGERKGVGRPPEIAGTWARVPRHISDLAGTFE